MISTSLPQSGVPQPAPGDRIDAGSLTREQMVDRIIQINPSATTAFLQRFTVPTLQQYLDHLTHASVPRGGSAVWVRPADMPAIVGVEAED